MGRLVRACRCVRTIRSPDALCRRPLHLDERRAGQGRPRRLDGHRRPGGAHLGSAPRHHGHSGDVSSARSARERGGDGRPHLGRPGRARAGVGVDGARAPGVRLSVPAPAGAPADARRAARDRASPVDRGTGHVQRQPLHARKRARQAEATASLPIPPIIVGGRGTPGTTLPAARFADEYNVSWDSRPQEFPDVRQRVIEACAEVGRDPATMRFSIAIHCIVGETRDEAMDRARAIYDLRPRDTDLRRLVRRLERAAIVRLGRRGRSGTSSVCRGWRRSADDHAQPAHRPRLDRPDRRTPGTSARTLSARCFACRSLPRAHCRRRCTQVYWLASASVDDVHSATFRLVVTVSIAMPATTYEPHQVLGTPITPPFPDGYEVAVFGMGCFGGAVGAERRLRVDPCEGAKRRRRGCLPPPPTRISSAIVIAPGTSFLSGSWFRRGMFSMKGARWAAAGTRGGAFAGRCPLRGLPV